MSDLPDDGERRALADDARDILDNKAVLAAILALRKRYFELVMGAKKKRDKILLLEQIRALEDIPQQLQIFVNDEKMHQARKR